MGEAAGHPFRGNQYTTAGGVEQARVDKMVSRRGEFAALAGSMFSPSKLDGKHMTSAQREAAVILGHPTRNEHTAEFLTLASQIEEKYGTAAMLEAMGSTSTWYGSPSSAMTDWEAQRALGGAPGSAEVELALANKAGAVTVDTKFHTPEYEKAVLKAIDGGATPAEAIAKANKKFNIPGEQIVTRNEQTGPMDEKTVGAFAMRQAAAQRKFREENGDAEVEVYRGVKGPQARRIQKEFDAEREKHLPAQIAAGQAAEAKIKELSREQVEKVRDEIVAKRAAGYRNVNEEEEYARALSTAKADAYQKAFHEAAPKGSREVDLGVRGLSSWSTSEYDAGDFAGEKGAVLKMKIKASDVWHYTGATGARGVIRYVEDAGEVVVHSKTKTRRAEYVGAGHKVRKRSGGIF